MHVRCQGLPNPIQWQQPGGLQSFFLLCYNTDIKGERYGGDKEEVLGKGSDTHQ